MNKANPMRFLATARNDNYTWRLGALVVLFFLFLAPAYAQEAAKPEPVNEEAVKQLITTLESETARTEFITNLKLLLEQQGTKEEESIAPITQALALKVLRGNSSRTIRGFSLVTISKARPSAKLP
ncbi:MAG: hypothetical protein EBQ96_09750 [Proteobacteria bacterium]|nr:hypothetical protein [Pseudomonadota bacterium]